MDKWVTQLRGNGIGGEKKKKKEMEKEKRNEESNKRLSDGVTQSFKWHQQGKPKTSGQREINQPQSCSELPYTLLITLLYGAVWGEMSHWCVFSPLVFGGGGWESKWQKLQATVPQAQRLPFPYLKAHQLCTAQHARRSMLQYRVRRTEKILRLKHYWWAARELCNHVFMKWQHFY